MQVWLLTVGEPLPTDGGHARAWRTGLLAKQLVERGHDVTWWSSAFDHFNRTLRSPVDMPVVVQPRLSVWHLSGVAYDRNISLARLRNHAQVAKRFRKLAPAQPKPDVILSSLPTLELCAEAVDFGAARHVPVALDIRDLWPDVLFDVVPAPVRPLARLAVPWITRQLRHAATGATAILGVTDEFVRWGLEAGKRTATDRDRAFPMGYSASVPSADAQRAAQEFWRARGIGADSGSSKSIFCFFGTIGWMFDFTTVLAAAAKLRSVAPDVLFVLCGSGNKLDDVQRDAIGLDNVMLPGRVGAPEVWDLMRRSTAGLAPYRAFRNFDDNLPNKPVEYLSAGLPIVACRLHVLSHVIDGNGCGLAYAHGDVDGLVGAVLKLHREPAARDAMSARAAALFADRYAADRVYSAMASHLEAIAAD